MSAKNFLQSNSVFHVPNYTFRYVDDQLGSFRETLAVDGNEVNGEQLKPTYYFVAGEEVARGQVYIQHRYNSMLSQGDNVLKNIDGTVYWNGSNDSANGGFRTNNNVVMKDLDTFSLLFSFLYVGSATVWNGNQEKLLECFGGSSMIEIRLSYQSGMYKLSFYLDSFFGESEGFVLPDNLNADTRFILGIVKDGSNLTCYVNGVIVYETDTVGGFTGTNDHPGMFVLTTKGGALMNSVALFDGKSLTGVQVKGIDFDFMVGKPAYLEGIRKGFYSYE